MDASEKKRIELINEARDLERAAEYYQSIGNQIMYVTCSSTAKFKRAKAKAIAEGKL